MTKHLRPAAMALLAFTLLCGLAYPLALLAIGELLPSPRPAELVGRPFDRPGEFWGRPSATAYDAKTSAGANLAPSNPALREAVQQRIAALRAADPTNPRPVPVDLVTTSASGLDPDISPAAAYYQVARVARARGMAVEAVTALVDAHIVERTLGILGERRVPVVRLNQALEARAPR